MNQFLFGFKLPFQAISKMMKSPKLFGLTSLCAAITLLVIVSVIAFAYSNTTSWLSWVWAKPGEDYLKALWYVAWALLFSFVSLVGIQTLPILILAPFQDLISEATDEVLKRTKPVSFSISKWLKNTLNALILNLARVSIYLAGFVLLWLLHFIPMMGSIAFSICALVWSIFWMAFEFLSGVMSRWGFRFRQVSALLLKNKPESLGFGASLYLLSWIPILNFVFMPVAVIAATMLYWHLSEKNDTHPHRGE